MATCCSGGGGAGSKNWIIKGGLNPANELTSTNKRKNTSLQLQNGDVSNMIMSYSVGGANDLLSEKEGEGTGGGGQKKSRGGGWAIT